MSAAPGIHRGYWEPMSAEEWKEFYGIGQTGGAGMTFFQGSQHQRGSGLGALFGGLFRAIMPAAKSALKAVGREALRTGIGVASDALAGQNVTQALEMRGRDAASTLLNKAKRKLDDNDEQQTGGGVGTLLDAPTLMGKSINRAAKRGKRQRKKKQDILAF